MVIKYNFYYFGEAHAYNLDMILIGQKFLGPTKVPLQPRVHYSITPLSPLWCM